MKAASKTLKQRSSHRVLPVVFNVGGPVPGANQHRTAADPRNREVHPVYGSAECDRLFEVRRWRGLLPLMFSCHPAASIVTTSPLFTNFSDEAKAFARQGANQVLLLAAVANGLASRGDSAGERRLRYNTPLPYHLDKIVVADDALAIANKVFQDIEHLRPDRNYLGSAPEFPPIRIELVIFEEVNQIFNLAAPALFELCDENSREFQD